MLTCGEHVRRARIDAGSVKQESPTSKRSESGERFKTGDDGADVFVHYSGIIGMEFRKLAIAEPVEYDIVECDKGVKAVNVRVTE